MTFRSAVSRFAISRFAVSIRLFGTLPLFAVVAVAAVVGPAGAQDRRGPFTHEPRSVRSRDVDQQHLRLELRMDLEKQEFAGRAIHKLAPYRPLRSITFDAAQMRIVRVALVEPPPRQGEHELKFETRGAQLVVALDREHPAGESLQLAIDYRVTKPAHGMHFVAPDPSEPTQPKMAWTQGEPEFARYWYPCIDSSADRLTSEVAVTAATPYFVLSNGALRGKTANKDGTTTWHWVQEKSHVSYLMSVVVGEFEAMEQSWDGIPITSYVPKGRLADAPRSFEKTPAMMNFFTLKIGYRYPWPKYAQICVDEYGWGGMENTSATTLNLRTLHDERASLDVSSVNLVAHELAHQWWGDLLTCKDWGEIWLNESFATYFATLWTEHDEGLDEATWARRLEAQAYQDEDRRMRRSIVNYRYNSPENVFDRHAYPKGGRVLHMLRFELGDDLFWKALQRYVAVNQFRSVETADLRIAIEEATGQGYNWFFDQWLYHGGHPEFTVDWQWDDSKNSARVTVRQTQKTDETTPLFRSDVELEFAAPQSNVVRRVTLSKAEETFHFQLEQRPTHVLFDPRDWLLKTLKFDKSKQELIDQLARARHVVPRAQAAADLAQYAGDEDAIDALMRSARGDGFWGVRQTAVKSLAKKAGDEVRKTLIGVARGDAKSQVRREAITALAAFSHDDTRGALRDVVRTDRSYFTVAEALRTLVKIDRTRCEADLLAALETTSHTEVVERAACDGLTELKSTAAADRLVALLERPQSPERRATFVAALARLKPDQADHLERLKDQLDNDRTHVRRATIEALAALGTPQAVEWLQAHRGREEMHSMIQAVDEAIVKIRGKEKDVELLRKEVEDLRKQNRQLEERLKKLEQGAKK